MALAIVWNKHERSSRYIFLSNFSTNLVYLYICDWNYYTKWVYICHEILPFHLFQSAALKLSELTYIRVYLIYCANLNNGFVQIYQNNSRIYIHYYFEPFQFINFVFVSCQIYVFSQKKKKLQQKPEQKDWRESIVACMRTTNNKKYIEKAKSEGEFRCRKKYKKYKKKVFLFGTRGQKCILCIRWSICNRSHSSAGIKSRYTFDTQKGGHLWVGGGQKRLSKWWFGFSRIPFATTG